MDATRTHLQPDPRAIARGLPPGARVAVGMSGGVDSSAVAALLRDVRCDVVGVTALMTREFSRCCSLEDVETARRVAAALGIPHHVIELYEPFEREVVGPFAAEYLAGRTPSPCLACNRAIKFGRLAREARDRLGAEWFATGHYARVERDAAGAAHLRRGADPRKDQSYFLSRLAQDQLAAAVLPLGGAAKPDVVRYVTDAGLPCRPQRESQDLCFVSEAGPGVWIDLRTLEPPRPGDFVDREGRRLGRHRGIHHYTVGQRKGLGLFGPAPLYVIRIEAATNRIVVGPHDAAMGRRLRATDLTWTRGAPPAREFQALTQIRHSHPAAPSTVTLGGDGTAEVVFEAPQFAIAPGQAAAFYEGDEVLGAGWIVDWEA